MQWLIMLLAAFSAPVMSASLSLSPIFGNDMVLQRNVALPIFGTADPDATVTVSFAGQALSATADATGNWLVRLNPVTETGAPGELVVNTDSESVILTGVQVGEVWFCSGQSNMGFPLSNANDSAPAIADAGNRNIRLFRMIAGSGPATSSWQVSSSASAGSFSAVCYWMGLELSQWFDDVPVGLIQATHDGTSIDHWQHSGGGIGDDYDAMVRAIQPYAVRGVLWYQGESNGGDLAYAGKLTDMINEWRSDWDQEALPFGIVQLAYRSGWNTARNAQLEVADSIEDSFLVVIRDLPGGSLHPPEKKPVGIRSAIAARGLVYGEAITYSGPIRDLENSVVNGNTVVLKWKHPGDGLFTDDGLAPGEFKLAGANGRFKTADAAIVGDTVEVWSSGISDPVTVQYSYRSVGNLYNRVYVPSEGGSVIVDRLKASEFEISLAGNPDNVPPQARFSYGTNELTVNFDASESSDSDGSIVSWDWNFGDGSTATGLTVSHTYAAPGGYDVVLTVTDNGGASAQQLQTINVYASGDATSMHVDNIIAYGQGVGRGIKAGAAEVVIRDNLGNPVPNALVAVDFTGSFVETVTGQTDGSGFVKVMTTATSKGGVQVDACVADVSGTSLDYDPGQNLLTCAP